MSSLDYRNNLENYVRKEVNIIKQKNNNEELLKKLEPFKSKDMFESKRLAETCPICGGPIKTTRSGCICERYKKDATEEELACKTACKFGIGKICDKVIPLNNITQLLSEGKCDIVKGFTSKQGKKFDAGLRLDFEEQGSYKKCNVSFFFPEPEESNIQCPECSKKLIKNRFEFTCECGYKIRRVIAKKELSDSDVEKLVKGKTTSTIKGFKKKDGGTFSAKLTIDEEGKIAFKFPNKFFG